MPATSIWPKVCAPRYLYLKVNTAKFDTHVVPAPVPRRTRSHCGQQHSARSACKRRRGSLRWSLALAGRNSPTSVIQVPVPAGNKSKRAFLRIVSAPNLPETSYPLSLSLSLPNGNNHLLQFFFQSPPGFATWRMGEPSQPRITLGVGGNIRTGKGGWMSMQRKNNVHNHNNRCLFRPSCDLIF